MNLLRFIFPRWILPLTIMGWDDLLALLVKSAITSAAAKAASPSVGMTTPGQTPQGQSQMDLSALVSKAQQPSELPKLQLRNNLPPPGTY